MKESFEGQKFMEKSRIFLPQKGLCFETLCNLRNFQSEMFIADEFSEISTLICRVYSRPLRIFLKPSLWRSLTNIQRVSRFDDLIGGNIAYMIIAERVFVA